MHENPPPPGGPWLLADLPHRIRILVLALWAADLGGLTVFIVHVVFDVGRPDAPGFQALYVVIILLGSALFVARGALVERERATWLIFGAGGISWAAGYFYIALMLLLRARVTCFRTALWTDIGVAALALASIGAMLLIDPILASTGASLSAVVTNLAYPLLDLLVASVVLAIFTLSGWRRGRDMVILGVAFVILVVADTIYVHRVATAGYESGTLLDVSWPIVFLLIAAAWTKPRREGSLVLEGWSMAAAPLLFAVIALGLTTYDSFTPINKVAVGLATVTLILAFARTIATFADVRTLSHTGNLLRRQSLILDSAGEGIYGLDLEGRRRVGPGSGWRSAAAS